MARSTEVIYNSIIAQKQSLSALNGLVPLYNLPPVGTDNPFVELMAEMSQESQVGSWRLIAFVFAVILNYFEQLQDIFYAEVLTLSKQAVVAKSQWYAALAKRFQAGYIMVVDPVTGEYSYPDTTSAAAVAARIVTNVSANEVIYTIGGIDIGVEVIKVAQTASPGVLAPIVNPQLNEFKTFINRAKPAGVKTSIISMAADTVACDTIIYFDATLDPVAFAATAMAAINAFLTTGILFDGRLYLNGYTEEGVWRPGWCDSITAIPGCKGVEESNLQAAPANTGIFANIPFDYEPASGYYVLAPLGVNPGQANITFTPVS